MKNRTWIVLAAVVSLSSSLVVACERGGEGEASGGAAVETAAAGGGEEGEATPPAAGEGEATPPAAGEGEATPPAAQAEATPPAAMAEGSGGHHHDEHGEMSHVLEEGEYDPAAVVPQPGANLGDITACPVSGEVFEVTEDSPHVAIEGQEVYLCCPSCIRRLQRNPEQYL